MLPYNVKKLMSTIQRGEKSRLCGKTGPRIRLVPKIQVMDSTLKTDHTFGAKLPMFNAKET